MALYSIGNKDIFLKRAAVLDKIKNKDKKINEAKKYNHIIVQFSNNVKKDLLFTDNQIKKAMYRANHNLEDLPNNSWFRDFISKIASYKEDCSDLQKIENTYRFTSALKKYNHILVKRNDELFHLLFTDNDIEIAIERAKKNPEDLK